MEEKCTKEEAREVFENDPETVSIYRILWHQTTTKVVVCVQVSPPKPNHNTTPSPGFFSIEVLQEKNSVN